MPFKIPIYFSREIALIKITINRVTDATAKPIAPITAPKIVNVDERSSKNCPWLSLQVSTFACEFRTITPILFLIFSKD